MLTLILPYRHDIGIIEQNVGRHEHRVREEAGIGFEAFRHFIFIRVRLLQECDRHEALKYP